MNLIETLLRVTNKFQAELNRPHYFEALNETLYPAEIHMILTVGNRNGITVTQLADLVGITKGAVSQTVSKLEKKGLVNKDQDPDNTSRVLITLTTRGKAVYYAHEANHEERDKEVLDFLINLPDTGLLILENFFRLMETMVDRHIHSGDHGVKQ